MRLFGILAALLVLTGFSQPLTPMVKVTGTVVYPDGTEVDTTWWRVGLILGRSESATETVVYREPELWFIDRGSGEGQHLTDPGPTFGFHMPVVSLRGDLKVKGGILGLELGDEKAFLAARTKPVLIGVAPAVTHYLWTDGETGIQADLSLNDSGAPARIELSQKGTPLVTVVYDDYRTGLPVDQRLFEPPKNVAFRDLN